ncbi:MAG: acetyl-CoA carboxylase biotin carboxyl carrier protein [Kiritimatiellaeota bacterium]|nr:acetyl-CoA carboxylase biotin carboxyl carrier protein [Kiritimatiellota bacterium]
MDIEQIKTVIELMKSNELCEFEMEEEGFRIAIKRRNASEPQVIVSAPQAPMVMAAPAPAASAAAPAAPAAAPVSESGKKLVEIKSPIVGTFYRAPSPDAEPFASVGTHVDLESTVCIVEAMKVMNEIKAEVKGTIRKVLVENATPVQFGQAIFLVEQD